MATVTINGLSETGHLALELLDDPRADLTRAPLGLAEAIELLRSVIAAFDQFQRSDRDPEPSPPGRQRLIFRWAEEQELPRLTALGWSIARSGSYPGSWLLCREDSSYPIRRRTAGA